MEKPAGLVPWESTVARARAAGEARALLAREDADQAIRALGELEVYYAVKGLGPDQATPMLALLSPEQIRALFDLDAWHRHEVALSDVLLWLAAFAEAGPQALLRAAQALDPELFALLLRRRLLVAMRPGKDWEASADYPLPEWLRSGDEALAPVETPDGRFYLAARLFDEADPEGRAPLDEEERKLILELVVKLYGPESWEWIAGLLRAAADDLSSELEEDALRLRNARAEDLGFPPFERAVEVYLPLPPAILADAAPQRSPPVPLLLPAVHAERLSQGLFRQVMDSLSDRALVERVEAELVPLVNAALVADRVEPGAVELLRPVLDRVRANLELALAHEPGGRPPLQVAAERVARHPLRTLFRVGHGLTLALKSEARPLLAQRTGLGERERALLAALSEDRPSFPTMLEGGPPEGRRAISSPADLGLLRAELAATARWLELAAALELERKNRALDGIIDPPLPAERSYDMLFATGVARALLGERFGVEPLDGAALTLLARKVQDPTPSAEQVARGLGLADQRLITTAAERVELARTALAAALAPLVGKGEIDARFVGVVVRRLA